MSTYAAHLRALNDAVIDYNTAAATPLVASTAAMGATARLHIYRDSYCERLLGVTLADYPATAALLGEEALASHAQAYALAHVSGHWDINQYSLGFADFLATKHVDAEVVAIATLEAAIAAVFWMADSPAMNVAYGQSLAAEALAEATIRPRAAHRLLALNTDALAYLDGFRAGAAPAAMASGAHYVAIWRHENQVQRAALSGAEYHILQSLNTARSFGAALEQVIEASQLSTEDLLAQLPHLLPRWLQLGILAQP